MRPFLSTLALVLACAASAAAQSGRVKKPEPLLPGPTPTPETREEEQRTPAEQGVGDASADDQREPETDEEGNRVYLGRQVDQKARLLAKPEPGYPRGARRRRVRGEVVLRMVLAASGKVEKITVVKGLPEGVTEEAIKAARQIKFLPAEREGRKVSQRVTVVYNFNLY